MEDTLYHENRNLRRKLDDLLRQARTNEKKQELFDSFGFEIIGASSPGQLRDLLLFQMMARFQLHDVVLCLVDHDKDTDRLFFGHDEEARLIFEKRLVILDTVKDSAKIESLISYPLLGSKVFDAYDWMMAGSRSIDEIKSVAFLPLLRSDRIIGSLLLMSRDANRYQPGVGTEFLQKLSAMTAVAIENCLNQQRIKEIGYQDALTQAYNRRYFDLRFNDEISRSIRRGEDLTCMFLDVDHFKNVNDTYGHHIGDLVLMRMVSLIKEQVRACDIVARYGGEEFAVVLPATSLKTAHEIAERLRQAVYSEDHCFYDKQLKISISIGMTNLKNLMDDSQGQDAKMICTALLERADKALYVAKESGRNQVVVYSDLLTD